ncbi:MAG: hypothetical protein KDD15_22480 [Lewinella sp.]|nr:hypothetical protein [Lewinella sp.]
MNYKKYAYLIFLLGFMACGGPQIPVDDIENEPIPSAEDQALANVFDPLNGLWMGNFEVYRDDNLEPRDNDILFNPSTTQLTRANVNSIRTVNVTQRYQSITPYFQKVVIVDRYFDGSQVESIGVNKVQDGKMWCVMHKPEETVIHHGSTDGPNTIIWQRNEQNPQRIEYFRETVEKDRYTILGWGYYEGDDTTRMPRYWYYGLYTRDY